MMLRTPLQKRKMTTTPPYIVQTPGTTSDSQNSGDKQIVQWQHPTPLQQPPAQQSETGHLCTYQCLQMVKSEFVEAYSTAKKNVADLEYKLETMNNELIQKEIDRKRYEEQLHYVEQELDAARGRQETLQEQLTKEADDSFSRSQVQLIQIAELETKLDREVKLRKDAESCIGLAEEKVLQLEGKLQSLTENTEWEKRRVQKEFSLFQEESNFVISQKNVDLELMETQARNVENELHLLRDQLEKLQRELAECREQKGQDMMEALGVLLPLPEATSSNADILVKQLRDELSKCEAEVREARHLKSAHVNAELLKERLLEERHQREQAESELQKSWELQQNALKFELELQSWKLMSKQICGVESVDAVLSKFSSLQKELIVSSEAAGKISSRAKELEIALEKAETDRRYVETQVASAGRKLDEKMRELKSLELTVSSITVERDKLRSAVKMFETEAEVWSKQRGSDASRQRVDACVEASVRETDNITKELEHNMSELREVIKSQNYELELLNEKLNSETRRVKYLEHEGDRLRSEISLLEYKLGHGDYSTENTKVLRMVNTLAVDSEAKHTIETLHAELQRAQAKLRAIEDLKGQFVVGESVDYNVSEKLAQLKGQIAILEKREERYKAVFAEKISVFRRACCSLFGFKIVMDERLRPTDGIPVAVFSLHSIYAQSDDEKLEFEYESGNATIVMNSYTQQPDISKQVDIFIRRYNSIPAFTANLTIESFNRRTLS